MQQQKTEKKNADTLQSDKQKMDSVYTLDMQRHYCRTCLSKTWAKATNAEISIVPVSGGLSNYLFKASLPESMKTQPDEPNEVLIRIFGEILSQNAESVVLDSVIFALLSEKRMGPHLYGVFKGGRIEEFVANSVPLKREQLSETRIHTIISQHLARLHRLEMPLSKEPRFVFKMMNSWLRSVAELGGREQPAQAGFNATPIAHFMRDFRVIEEIAWLKDVFENKFKFPVVFCHNDLQENNILCFNDSTKSQGFNLQLIDFEYCSYNWRAFDFGNFFNEWALDYMCTEWPYFSYHPGSYPNSAAQLSFLRSYLRWYKEPQLGDKVPVFPTRRTRESSTSVGSNAIDGAPVASACTEDEAALLLEAKYGALLSHFFWSVWSLLQASVSSIHFDFKEYAKVRFQIYARFKSELTGKPSGLPTGG